MAASMITSPIVAPTSVPSLSRRGSSFAVVCSGGKKIKVDKPLGLGGGLTVDIDANGRKVGKKGVYQFVDKYGANVDGYSPIYTPEEWSESGDRYAGERPGFLSGPSPSPASSAAASSSSTTPALSPAKRASTCNTGPGLCLHARLCNLRSYLL
ncbi:unnamed protein product [Triticum turgidum subsp. durum]|nr:unnamed protein product [Triticum turgidum subsp. durum]